MNTRQLKYAIKLAESLNFSQVAEQLNISQPALSKQILKLEADLGVKLFDREKNPLELTSAGEYFVREAQELLYKEDQLIHTMEQFKTGEKRRVVIGISPFRSLYLIPMIVRKLQEKFPGIQVILRETGSDSIRKEIIDGKYDFAIVNLPVDEAVLDVTPIQPDILVVAVPNNLLHVLQRKPKKTLSEIDFAECRELPFITVGQTQELRVLFENLCARAQFHPSVIMEVVGVTTAWAMAQEGIGATVIPLQFINNEAFDKNITLFTIKNNMFSRQPAIVTRRGQYLSEHAQYAIELICENYSEM